MHLLPLVGKGLARPPVPKHIGVRLRAVVAGQHLREGRTVVPPVARGDHDISRPSPVGHLTGDVTVSPLVPGRGDAVLATQQFTRLRHARLALHAQAEVLVLELPAVLALARDVAIPDAAVAPALGDVGRQTTAAPLRHHPLHLGGVKVEVVGVQDHLPLPRRLLSPFRRAAA